ncbi:hypothetical protein PAXRUDRAFT_833108 [Paxillus rubicundulus Ve08.2h10]|uniref:Unplaced genomic scaffold scaffold_1045, whole genome shotgun sequence n=1 Tax=Paxillus rubicundulus Ve08.2h10 TaxID=930991 RepID=A0A0D0CEG3_9AGAM|nr:hypothetical protein PAXRUDRAFT_833108 [Paxillus rubicundulus Ve08.2h10]
MIRKPNEREAHENFGDLSEESPTEIYACKWAAVGMPNGGRTSTPSLLNYVP